MKKYISLLFSFLVFAITANAQYKMVITQANGEKQEYQVWDIQNVTFEPIGSVETPTIAEAVDLGLSVKWAACNFGASTATAAGYYVGWGDATGLNRSTILNYFPVLNPTADIVNGKYDIVHVLWGDQWRMPTAKEVKELIDGCNWTYDEAKKGWTVTSKTDATKSIFLPMLGSRNGETISGTSTLGAYWSGSLSTTDNQKASALVLDAVNNTTDEYLRYLGLQIRPVYGPFYEGAKVKSATVTNRLQNEAYITVAFEGNYSDADEIGVCYGTTTNLDPDQSATVNHEVADIKEDGTCTFHLQNLESNTTYYFAPYIVCAGKRNMGSTGSFATQPKYPVAEMVDLGLSVKWAKWNVGASSENEYGSYIAWGDPTGENTSFNNSDYPNEYSDIAGTEYDVATKQWGDKWRMPTPEEWKELDNLEKELVTLDNGTKVIKVNGSNGNYIYLPRGGYQTSKGKQDVNVSASYWTSSNTAEVFAQGVTVGKVSCTFEKEDQKGWHMLVRPVYGDQKSDPDTPVTPTREYTDAGKLAQGVDLGLSVKWATYNLGTTSETEPGSYFSWGSTTAGTDFSRKQYQWYTGEDTKPYNIPTTNISDTDYDAAVQLWGGTWRMPTEAEINELMKNCTWTKTDNGFKIKGTNGNEIFLPFTGSYSGTSLKEDRKCFYWSGTYNELPLHAEDYWAYYLTNTDADPTLLGTYLYKGMCIRPVCTK